MQDISQPIHEAQARVDQMRKLPPPSPEQAMANAAQVIAEELVHMRAEMTVIRSLLAQMNVKMGMR